MEANTNRYGVIDGGQPRAQHAQGDPVNQPIPADRRSLVFEGDSDKEEELIYKRRQPRMRGSMTIVVEEIEGAIKLMVVMNRPTVGIFT